MVGMWAELFFYAIANVVHLRLNVLLQFLVERFYTYGFKEGWIIRQKEERKAVGREFLLYKPDNGGEVREGQVSIDHK